MNYLSLCRSLMVECGISGTLSSAVSQTGEFGRVSAWIASAWNEIQNSHEDWWFMRSSYLNAPSAGTTFPTTSGRSVYPLGTSVGSTCMVAAANFGRWDTESFRCFTTSIVTKVDELNLAPISYDDWRNGYMMGAQRLVTTRPFVMAVSPDDGIVVGPPPNGLYTIEGDYFVAPQVLAADADVPTGLPAQYHMLIVYRAMKKYAGYEAAPEVAIRAEDEYVPMYRQLESKYGQEIETCGALA